MWVCHDLRGSIHIHFILISSDFPIRLDSLFLHFIRSTSPSSLSSSFKIIITTILQINLTTAPVAVADICDFQLMHFRDFKTLFRCLCLRKSSLFARISSIQIPGNFYTAYWQEIHNCVVYMQLDLNI